MPKGDDYHISHDPEPDEGEGVALEPVGPRRRRRRRRRPVKLMPSYKLKDFLPTRKVGIAEAVALVPLALVAFLIGQTTVWVIGVFLLLGAFGVLAHRVFSDFYKTTPVPRRIWDACYSFVAFIVWLAVAPAGPGYVRVIVENNSGHDVVLEVDGGNWAEVKAGTQERNESLPRKPFELVTRDAHTREELDCRRIDQVSGRRYILNVLGGNTYFTGSVHYESAKLLEMRARMPSASQFNMGHQPDGPHPVKDVWIHADHNFLFEAPPGQIRGTGGRSYLTRSPPY